MSWTEEDIRAVMDDHRPGNEGFCLCAWGPGRLTTQIFDADHLVDLLGRRTARPQLPPPVEEPDYLKYDGVEPCPDSHACDCLGNGGACWYCYTGQHDKCTSHMHGDKRRCSLGRKR